MDSKGTGQITAPCVWLYLLLRLIVTASLLLLLSCSTNERLLIPTNDDMTLLLEQFSPQFRLKPVHIQRKIAMEKKEGLLLFFVEDACQADLSQHCATADAKFSCLVEDIDQLSHCCRTSFSNNFSSGRLPFAEQHGGIELPAGTLFRYPSGCGQSIATTSQVVSLGDLQLSAGPIVFNEQGKLARAAIAGGRLPNGAHVGLSQRPVDFHNSGLPVYAKLVQPFGDNGLVYETHKGFTAFSSSGSVMSGYVSGDDSGNVTIAGIRYKAGIIRHHANGQLMSGELADAFSHDEYLFPTSSVIHYSASGAPDSITLPGHDRSLLYELNRFKVGMFWLRAGKTLQFDESGKLRRLSLDDYHAERGKLYPASTTVELDDDGRIVSDSFTNRLVEKQASAQGYAPGPVTRVLDRDTVFRGLTIPSGSHLITQDDKVARIDLSRPISFHGVVLGIGPLSAAIDEHALTGRLAYSQSIDGIFYGPELMPVSFVNGQLTSGILAHAQEVHDVQLKALTEVRFNSTGELAMGTLSAPAMIAGVDLPADVRFYLSGDTLLKVVPEKPVRIGGLRFAANEVRFRPKGQVRNGILAQATVIDGQDYPAYTDIFLDADGHVIDSRPSPYLASLSMIRSRSVRVGPEPAPWLDMPRLSEEFCARYKSTGGAGLSLPLPEAQCP